MKTFFKLQRLSLLQQWRHDSFRLIFLTIVLLIFSAIMLWILPLFTQGNVHAGYIGLVCGLAANFWFTCIAQLDIDCHENSDELERLLHQFKYEKTPEGFYDLPVARYKKFKSQRIYIVSEGYGLSLRGPYNILKKITKKLNVSSSQGKDDISG
ncbi:hypothetical protein ACLHDD_20305 [Pantoea sp. NSTU24]|uniref:hypothetical protein n=1 Tax=Pantoea sp. NSTU24 TaxID=3391144 RepID=UPI003D07A545